MRFLDRRRARKDDTRGGSPRGEVREVKLRGGGRVDVVGESFYQDALGSICGGKSPGGHQHVCIATLFREPDNPYDRNAIAVYIDGLKVGHLSRDNAIAYQAVVGRLAADNTVSCCDALIVGGWNRPGGEEGNFGVQLDLESPPYAHPDDPPLSPEPTSTWHSESPGVRTGLSASPRLDVGMVEGRHYTEWTETVKDMKRLGHLKEALGLVYQLCTAAESESEQAHQTLPPWYFEQAAIIERKLRNYEAEVVVLKRYSASRWAVPGHFNERLDKAITKVARNSPNRPSGRR